MSWSISYLNIHGKADELEPPDFTDDGTREQYTQARLAAIALIQSRALGADDTARFNVSLSGHYAGNPGDYISVSINRTSAPVVLDTPAPEAVTEPAPEPAPAEEPTPVEPTPEAPAEQPLG